MKRRFTTEAKLGVALALVLAVIGTEASVRQLRQGAKRSAAPPEPPPQSAAPKTNPPPTAQAVSKSEPVQTEKKETGLRTGSVAPDFSLPGEDGKKRRLREFADKRTILAFYCGCSRCAMMTGMLQRMRALVADQRPHYVVVSTMPPESLPSWKEKTEFDGLLLVANRKDPVIETYGGHPCPRVYVLDSEQRVSHISPAPTEVRPASEILNPLAKAMGSAWITTPEIESGAPVPTFGEATLNPDASRK